MTARRRTARALTAGEKRLWATIASTVRPFDGRAVPDVEPEPASTPAAEVPAASPAAGSAPPVPPPRPKLAPLAPPEPKLRRALSRGSARPEASLDLHGFREAEAHAALLRFVARSQADGCRLVQVVTGKGRLGGEGVLRRLVPLWLAAPTLRRVVLGFEEAAPHRGGGGALYVRLRKPGGGA